MKLNYPLVYCIGRLLLERSIYERRKLLAKPKYRNARLSDPWYQWFSRSRPYDQRYIVDLHSRLVYDPGSDIGNLLFTTGAFERDEIEAAADLIKRGGAGTVIDIGANVGLHTITWANQCPQASFYAFEPTPTVYSALCTSIGMNSLRGRIEPVNAALGDIDGTADLFETTDDAYNSLKNTHRKALERVTTVDVHRLDTYVAQKGIRDISFIKIDAEGTEDAVLRGAVRTIEEQKPILFVEVYGGTSSNVSPEATIRWISDLGYTPYVMTAGHLTAYTRHSDSEYNYFFIPQARHEGENGFRQH